MKLSVLSSPLGRLVACAAVAASSACGGDHPAAPTAAVAGVPAPAPPARVLVISIDGLRPDAIQSVQAPAILGLAARGAATWRACTVSPPETLPAHGSMISGVEPGAHGITWGDYQPSRGLIRVPTMFSVARAAGRRTAMVTGKNGFRHYLLPGTVDHFADLNGGADAVATEAMGVLGWSDLLLVHFADVDLAGHRSGWMGPAYLEALRRVDANVERLLSAAGPEVTVILTADHGGTGRDHLGGHDENVHIPWVIAGPRVAAGRTLGMGVMVKDTAPTVLHLMGLPEPAGTTGRVVTEAFRAR